jgi:WD40 repeat protein
MIDCTLRLWDLETGEEVRKFEGHQEAILGVACSPDGRRALSASRDYDLRLWDLETGKELRRFRRNTMVALLVAFSPDGRRAYTGGPDGTVQVWALPESASGTNQTETIKEGR